MLEDEIREYWLKDQGGLKNDVRSQIIRKLDEDLVHPLDTNDPAEPFAEENEIISSQTNDETDVTISIHSDGCIGFSHPVGLPPELLRALGLKGLSEAVQE